jgi:hypothetical protein
VLRVEQLMQRGWILMHDVDLPGLIERAVAAGRKVDHVPVYGAKHVFDLWPYEKVRSGNIGAIRIPKNRKSLGAFLARLRELPSEVSPGSWSKRWRAIDALTNPPPSRRWFSRSA